MRKLLLILTLLLLLAPSNTVRGNDPNWGQTGHRTVGKIAENHLTNRARKKIEKLLDGQSLAFVSTYGDDIKSDDRYDKYYTWHFVNFPLGDRYEDSPKEEKEISSREYSTASGSSKMRTRAMKTGSSTLNSWFT